MEGRQEAVERTEDALSEIAQLKRAKIREVNVFSFSWHRVDEAACNLPLAAFPLSWARTCVEINQSIKSINKSISRLLWRQKSVYGVRLTSMTSDGAKVEIINTYLNLRAGS